jgi:hypothetical protein
MPSSLSDLSEGLCPSDSPERSLAGAPCPAPLAWLTRFARSPLLLADESISIRLSDYPASPRSLRGGVTSVGGDEPLVEPLELVLADEVDFDPASFSLPRDADAGAEREAQLLFGRTYVNVDRLLGLRL